MQFLARKSCADGASCRILGKRKPLPKKRLVEFYCQCLAILESFTIEFGFFGFAAFRATLRFVLKSFLSVEFLFAVGKREFLVAISADNVFVGHVVSPVFYWGSNILGLSRKHKEWAHGNVESLLVLLCLNTQISVNTFFC